MHFIEDSVSRPTPKKSAALHTSKRMHFIEESRSTPNAGPPRPCIRQNVCTSLRKGERPDLDISWRPCIRQNVCTSLRTHAWCGGAPTRSTLHTSKRMHFIEELQLVLPVLAVSSCIRQNVCTSLRIRPACRIRQRPLHLHTSKRMHFIEECSS